MTIVDPNLPEQEGQAPVLPVATARQTFVWLRAELATRRAAMLRIAVIGVIGATAATVPSLAFGVLVDRITDGASSSVLLPIAVIAGVAALISGLAIGFGGYAIAALGAGVLADLRESVVHSALWLPVPELERVGTGDLLSRVGNDVSAVTKAVSTLVPTVVSSVLLTGVSVIAMLGLDWRLGLAGAVALPMYALTLRWFLPRSTPRYAAERRAVADRSQVLVESIVGARTVRAYALDRREVETIETSSGHARDLTIGVFTLFTRMVGRVNRAEFVGLAAVLIVGYVLVQNGSVTVGATTAAALLFHRLFNPIGMLLYSFDDLQLAGAGLARLVGVAALPVPGSDAESGEQLPPAPADNALELRDVAFTYDGLQQVLRGIELTVPAGKRVALVGVTGAGKSTVAGIAAGTLAPTSGSVRLGGVPLDALAPGQLRRHVVILSQEVHVFAGPLVDDLRLAAPEASVEQIRDALGLVDALGWVDRLPDGLNTVVGEGGHAMTAAQAQQLALARLVLVDPPVAVLDEATAEAGSLGARELERAADAATAGRTTLVVAHRLSQAAAADLVVVLDRGKVVEQGTPDALRAADGRFAELWSAWAETTAKDLRTQPGVG
ncbi:ABC transporter ATP-binding protein [Aldersonia kunmingensis]|uniref:ABC transporter ATP-binding protein n=1 Tax=Aldersonia kunmingensis TaxID=408066 RepID=UPI00082D3439|nr:ABC transporter ATP-binding protein [Aldersonia kunmingensis]